MERKGMMKDHPWERCCEGDDGLSGFSKWPPRAYICSFCRREFRSAQALGGHMNVHRRDRARLRHSPPPPSYISRIPPNPNPNPNLNPNSNPNPDSNVFSSPSLWGSSSSMYSQSSSSTSNNKRRGLFGCEEKEEYVNGLKKAGFGTVRLDLDIGDLGASEEDLDLELRLGYS